MAEFYREEHVDAIRAVDGKWLVIEEDGTSSTWEHDKFMRTFKPVDGEICESCGNYIDVYSDEYFAWADGVYTCKICGGPE